MLDRLTWLRDYVAFLAKMGFKHPATFARSLPVWSFYEFLPGLTRRTFTPPILQYKDVEEAARIFYRDGFVVLSDGLEVAEAQQLGEIVKQKADGIVKLDLDGALPADSKHGDKRYCFGEYGHSPEWEYLAHNPRILPIVKEIWRGHAFRAIAAGGDFVLPGGTWQPLHNDMTWKAAGEKIPRVIIVNYYVSDVLATSGPIRQVPGTARFPVPNRMVRVFEPEWMKRSVVTGKRGYAIIRDPRTWHGGTPNTSDAPRYMPNLEYILRDVPIDEIEGSQNLVQLKQGKWIAEFPNA